MLNLNIKSSKKEDEASVALLKPLVSDLKKIYESFTERYYSNATLVTKIQNLEICISLQDILENTTKHFCDYIPNTLFISMIIDFICLLLYILNSAVF